VSRQVDNWIDGFLEYTDEQEAPTRFKVASALWALSTVVQRRYVLSLGFLTWVPNMYVLLVGPAGTVQKSTSISVASKLASKAGVHFGADRITLPALFQEMAKPEHLVRYSLSGEKADYTPWALKISELGTFLHSDSSIMVDNLTEWWDSNEGPSIYQTKTLKTDTIWTPYLSLIGGTTPPWLQGHVEEHMLTGGFFSRIIFIYEDKKAKLNAYPGYHEESFVDYQLENKLVNDLKYIRKKFQGYAAFSERAYEWGKDWYADLAKKSRHMSRIARTQYARRQTQVHKLALLYNVAHSDELLVTEHDLIWAANFLDGTERDLEKIMLDKDSTNPLLTGMNKVRSFFSLQQTIPASKLNKILSEEYRRNEIQEILSGLVETGELELEMRTRSSIYKRGEHWHGQGTS